MTELECGPIFIQPLLRHSVLMQALRATAAAAAFNNRAYAPHKTSH
jgi:hypothetical protein